MYVITGATGNVGRVIADLLLSQRQKVRVIGRDARRLRYFADHGAEMATGSVQDANFLKDAFGGATAVFTMIPPEPQAENQAASQDRVGEAQAQALADARVRKIVNLSSIGAEHESGCGPISGLSRHEKRLNRLEADILHLRPAYFMENFLFTVGLIRNMGIVGTCIKADMPMAMIATKDIGRVAAERLIRGDFEGSSEQYLLGPRDYTHAEVTRAIGNAIGKPELPYVQFSYEDAEKGMLGMGMSADVVRSFLEMYRGLNERKFGRYDRDPETATPTTAEEFARTVFAPIYKAS